MFPGDKVAVMALRNASDEETMLTGHAASARAYIEGPACADQSIQPSKSTQARQAHRAGEATRRLGDAHRASKISHGASKLGLAHAPLTGMPPAPAECSQTTP